MYKSSFLLSYETKLSDEYLCSFLNNITVYSYNLLPIFQKLCLPLTLLAPLLVNDILLSRPQSDSLIANFFKITETHLDYFLN